MGAGAAALVGRGRRPRARHAGQRRPGRARARIRATVPPYVGYAESTGQLGLPQIPQLESTVALLTGTTRIRAFVASGDAWRADELTPTGEHGVYRAGPSEFLWDFEANQLTRVLGIAAARLPRASDLLPPDLARRLLALAGTDPVTALPSRRVAGRDAAGLRVTPTDPQTTVGSVDIWADPTTALPLRVEVAGRTGPALLTTELLEVTDGPPDPALLRPSPPAGRGLRHRPGRRRRGRAQGAERAPAAREPRRAGPGWRCRARRCPASASTARGWPRSCSCRPAATSPSAPSTRPPPRAGSPSRCRRAARPASPRPCCRWPCAPAAGRARCCSARSTPPCWTRAIAQLPGRRPT